MYPLRGICNEFAIFFCYWCRSDFSGHCRLLGSSGDVIFILHIENTFYPCKAHFKFENCALAVKHIYLSLIRHLKVSRFLATSKNNYEEDDEDWSEIAEEDFDFVQGLLEKIKKNTAS